MTFPDGWTTHNGAQAVVAVTSGGCRRAVAGAGANSGRAARAFLSQQGITGGATARAT
jgi:predicted Zn-dependent protease